MTSKVSIVDVEVFGAKIDPKSYGWAKAHLDYTLHQQSSHKDGRSLSKGETAHPEDEQFAAATLAEMTYRLGSMRLGAPPAAEPIALRLLRQCVQRQVRFS
jgi:hypothetical protein